jgi:D-alanyl-D-alanine carboxypeptidase
MKKRDVQTDILRNIPIAHSVPKRLQPLFYSILAQHSFQSASASEQLLISQVAWVYCRIIDCQDVTRIFGKQNYLPDVGKSVTTTADMRDKQAELEMVPVLQKQLVNLIAALQALGKRSHDATSLESVIEQFENAKSEE